MFVLGELALWLGADSQGGRIGREKLREIPFDFLELAKQLVVFSVRDCRTVENVVFVRCAGQMNPQLLGPLTLLLAGFRWSSIGAGTLGWILPLLL